MSEGFGKTLTREMTKWLKHHLSHWRPLPGEEAMLLFREEVCQSDDPVEQLKGRKLGVGSRTLE